MTESQENDNKLDDIPEAAEFNPEDIFAPGIEVDTNVRYVNPEDLDEENLENYHDPANLTTHIDNSIQDDCVDEYDDDDDDEDEEEDNDGSDEKDDDLDIASQEIARKRKNNLIFYTIIIGFIFVVIVSFFWPILSNAVFARKESPKVYIPPTFGQQNDSPATATSKQSSAAVFPGRRAVPTKMPGTQTPGINIKAQADTLQAEREVSPVGNSDAPVNLTSISKHDASLVVGAELKQMMRTLPAQIAHLNAQVIQLASLEKRIANLETGLANIKTSSVSKVSGEEIMKLSNEVVGMQKAINSNRKNIRLNANKITAEYTAAKKVVRQKPAITKQLKPALSGARQKAQSDAHGFGPISNYIVMSAVPGSATLAPRDANPANLNARVNVDVGAKITPWGRIQSVHQEPNGRWVVQATNGIAREY